MKPGSPVVGSMSQEAPPATVPIQTADARPRRGFAEERVSESRIANALYWLIAVGAVLWCGLTIDPSDQLAWSGDGPGLTLDEGFNVELGVAEADRLLDLDLAGYARVTGELPDHPPLGRLLLGLVHELGLIVLPVNPMDASHVVGMARLSSAIAFGLLLFLIGRMTRWLAALIAPPVLVTDNWPVRSADAPGESLPRWEIELAGIGAMLLLLLMPRMQGHARLAALEMWITLLYVAVLCHVAVHWTRSQPPAMKISLFSGFLWGLALLTKVQAILLPLPLLAWALWRWRHRAIVPLLLSAFSGTVTLLLGWPWLWGDLTGRISRYLGRTAQRETTYAWYFGQTFADRDLPWHYPWVIFGATLPVATLILLGVGLSGWHRSRARVDSAVEMEPSSRRAWVMRLLGLGFVFPLCVFSLPGVPVYDAERLFLSCFPLAALFGGLGTARVACWLRQRHRTRLGMLVATVVVAVQLVSLIRIAPCYLSGYGGLVGGLSGADKFGLPLTYWGDSITPTLLRETARQLPAGSVIHILPTMHQFQLQELGSQTAAFQSQQYELRPFDKGDRVAPRYVLMFRRLDYLEHDFRGSRPPGKVLAEVQRAGVWLAALIEVDATSFELRTDRTPR